MRDLDPAKLRRLEATARNIAKQLDAAVNHTERRHFIDRPTGRFGFALLLFSFDGPELTWISNAERESMTIALEELLVRFRDNTANEFPGGVDARN